VATDKTTALMALCRTRLLSFTTADSIAMSTYLGAGASARLFGTRPPDDVDWTLGVHGFYRLMNRRADGADRGLRETMDLELMLMARPLSQALNVERAADVADQAMLNWADHSGGLVFCRQRSRDTMVAPDAPMDTEVYTVRCVYPLVVWPQLLTQYAGAAG
jgi:hypothetical protein